MGEGSSSSFAFAPKEPHRANDVFDRIAILVISHAYHDVCLLLVRHGSSVKTRAALSTA